MLDSVIRCFIDIVDIPSKNFASKTVATRKRSKFECDKTYYEVATLVVLLSKLKALGGSGVQEISISLRSGPSFHLIKNDPLELEKVKMAQAIEEFLKA